MDAHRETSVFLDLLKQKSDLISGVISPESSIQTKTDQRNAWEEVARELNAYGLGKTKNGSDIKKKWQDLKCRVRKKALKHFKHRSGTGGGPAPVPLTDLDNKVIDLLGPASFTGIPQTEEFDSLIMQQSACDLAAENYLPPSQTHTVEEEYAESVSAAGPSLNGTMLEDDWDDVENPASSVISPMPAVKNSTARVRKFRRKQRAVESKKRSDIQELIAIKREALDVKKRVAKLLEIQTKLKCLKQGVNFEDMLNE